MTVTHEDIRYEISNGAATITINHPDKYNALRVRNCEELSR